MLLLCLQLNEPYLLEIFEYLLLLANQLMMLLLEVLHVGYVLSDHTDLLLTVAVLCLVHWHLVDQLVGLSLQFLDQTIGLTQVVL